MIASIEKGVSNKEMRLMARANRQMLLVRRQLKASTVNAFLKHALPAGSEALSRLSPFVSAVCSLDLETALCMNFVTVDMSCSSGHDTGCDSKWQSVKARVHLQRCMVLAFTAMRDYQVLYCYQEPKLQCHP